MQSARSSSDQEKRRAGCPVPTDLGHLQAADVVASFFRGGMLALVLPVNVRHFVVGGCITAGCGGWSLVPGGCVR